MDFAILSGRCGGGAPQSTWRTVKEPLEDFVEAANAAESRRQRHFGHRQACLVNQLLRQQDTSCLCDRDRGRTEVLSKQEPELSLSDAQAFGEAIDTGFIECTSVDERQRPRHGVRRPAPGGKLWRRFRPTAQARAETSFLRRCCRRVERHVSPFRHRGRADRTAIDPGCSDPGEEPTVEARVASPERAITRVNIEVHDRSLLPVAPSV